MFCSSTTQFPRESVVLIIMNTCHLHRHQHKLGPAHRPWEAPLLHVDSGDQLVDQFASPRDSRGEVASKALLAVESKVILGLERDGIAWPFIFSWVKRTQKISVCLLRLYVG